MDESQSNFNDAPCPALPHGTGEINNTQVFKALDRIGYGGWIGGEYKPVTSTEAGPAWLDTHLVRPRDAAAAASG